MQGRRVRAITMICIFVAVTLLIAGYSFASQAETKKRILIVHSYHKGLQWTDNIDDGILSVLRQLSPHPDIHTEYMDTKHFSDERHVRKLYELFEQKYRTIAFDAIIVSDEDAFHFMLKHHDSLFPNIPVIFCGVNFFDASVIEKQRDIYTGVVEAYDVRNTLRTALKLHPESFRIVVINDRSVTGLANRKILGEVLPEFDKKYSVIYFEDLDMDELLKKVQALTPGDLILLMTFNRDRSGRVFDYDESIALISAASKVPIYGVWDFYLGRGIVGGMVTSGRDQGRVAAEMALKVLSGTSVRDIPVVKESPNRFMFDYTQMMRYEIRPQNLPEGSLIINRPVSFYTEHKGKVWAVTAIITVLTAMLVALMINIQQRKRTEASLRMSEEKFEKIFRHSPDWITIINLADSTYIDVNDVFLKTTGFARDEVIGKTSLDIGIYVDPEQRYELDERFLREGRMEKQEILYRMKSG
ncbi:MAG TPA: ABC transporter substrate binding protein, partial [Dissulfurispiraceae bacterium]|nr:ABC transporter substrate binding protein [Dissulfurispiraceae bacterium]